MKYAELIYSNMISLEDQLEVRTNTKVDVRKFRSSLKL